MSAPRLKRFNPLFILAASAFAVCAQEKPVTPEKLKAVVVKGTSIGGEVTAVSPALTLSGKVLADLSQSTLGDVLADIPGVASSYFGPNSGRPIIRGLEGDRLKITQNGTSSLDASSASPDHAVSVDPLTIREVQVLRGPAALLYSSSIMGGVINLLDNRIPVERLPRSATLFGRMGSADGLRALSVLTDEKFFGGTLDDLLNVTAHFRSTPPARPCIRKDFFVHPVQVLQARAAGASAILIIVRALTDEEITALAVAATAAGLDALFEIHTEPELARALAHGARIIGVNNRDLSTFKTDLGLSERLIPLFPSHVTAVSESGIHTAADAARVRAAGAHAILGGEALMKAPDPAVLLSSFRSA